MAIIATAKVQSIETHWQGEIRHGQHVYLTDKPASFGGQDAGPAPYDFIVSGLISCTMITLRMYAQHKGLDLGTFSVDADFHANKAGEEWIERRLSFSQPLADELAEKLLAVCQKTPVTKTLLRSVDIKTELV